MVLNGSAIYGWVVPTLG